MTKLRRPCENCPWRVDAPAGFWDPQHFLDIWKNCQDDGTHVMLCHKSRDRIRKGTSETALPPDVNPIVCQGWIRVIGSEAIGVRLALMRGTVTPDEVADLDGPALFPSFAAMLRANKIAMPRRNQLTPIRKVRR